jgi:hypothetical protein
MPWSAVRDDEVIILRPMLSCPSSTPIPCLHVPSPVRPSAYTAAALLADRDDEVPIPRNPPRFALVLCDSNDKVLILHRMLVRPRPSP